MIQINCIDELFNLEPMKYQSCPASASPEVITEKVNMLINTNNYIYSLKTDGNYGRMIWTDEEFALQSRSISKKTGEYGRLEDKVLFAQDMIKAFSDTTVLIGEIYLDDGVDRDVGTLLRCLPDKAIARQTKIGAKQLKYRIFDCFYYEGKSLLEAPITERIQYLSKAAAAINNPLVSYVKYYEAKPETFWNKLDNILTAGGEGVVLYHKLMTPCEGRTSAGKTLKVKQRLKMEADCFILKTEPPKEDYTGKEITTWQYWENTKTLDKLQGSYYLDFYNGGTLRPITKSYYYGWPGSIVCAVYDDKHEIIPLCKCSNLTEDLMIQLRDNFEKYYLKPCKIDGMAISRNRENDEYSIRHPKLLEIRDDIDINDCTLSKIIGKE